MQIALDATPLTGPVGGIRRYTMELAGALQAAYPEDRYRLVSDQPCEETERVVPTGIDRNWWLIGLPRYLRRERIDLFHGTDFAVPYLPVCPSVMTVHDLSPWRMDGASSRMRRRTPWLLRMGLATMVITPTEAVRREVIEHFRLSPEEVAAVHEAPAKHFRPSPGAPAADPYFLFVGTLEPRKNVDVVVEAWKEVRRRHRVGLILAGRLREGYPQPPGIEGLTVLGEVREGDLPGLYSNAVAALYPSSYEGFGLPVVEAMACGAAVIASRDAAIREVAGGACLLEEARDTAGFVAAMVAVLTDESLRKGLQVNGLRRAAYFGWERAAAQTRAVYEKAMRRFRG